jgi:RNA recognition motif-containing protein
MESFLSAPLINCFKFYWSTQQNTSSLSSAKPVTPVKSSAAKATSSVQDIEQNNDTTVITRADYAGEVKTIYVGNLPYRANEAAIRSLFAEHGLVLSVRLVKDRDTGKRRGYGFVEMPAAAADSAIATLNETEYLQRTLKVREANEKKELKPEDESSNSAEL